jgi:hypothetical protein
MANTFVYSISKDIPGGVFTGSTSTRLYMLITDQISVQLLEISSADDILTIRFLSDLSAKDKTTLDGDQLAPAGGLVGACADYVEMSYNSQILNDYAEIKLPADGITSALISLQLRHGDGTLSQGDEELLDFNTLGLCPINKSSDNFNISGAATFVIGPCFNRGTIETTIAAKFYNERYLNAKFI